MYEFNINRTENFKKTIFYRVLGTLLILISLFILLQEAVAAQPGFVNFVEKTSTFSGSLCPESIITYKVTISTPFGAVDNAKVTDELPEHVEYVAESATNGAQFLADPDRIVWDGPVSIGNPNSFEFKVRVLPDTPNGTVITNIAEGILGEGDTFLLALYFDSTDDVVSCPVIDPTPTPTMTPTQCTSPPTDIVAWWPLDETSGMTAADIAGYPNDGLYMDGPTPSSGIVAGGLNFDGIDDKVVVSDGPEIDFGTSDFTIDAWIRTDNATGYQPIVDKRNPGAADAPFGYSFFLRDGQLGFNINTEQAFGDGTSAGGIASGPDLADGRWHLVAVTVERDSRRGGRLYVDGRVVHTFPTNGLTGDADHNFNLIIGSRNRFFGPPVDNFFDGTMDEIEFFHRALSQDEIQAIYQAQRFGKCKEKIAGGEIHGIKWHDTHVNGVQDRESGLADWTILLENEASTVISTTTDADGRYWFTNLPTGEYTVTEVIQPGWTQSFPPKGVHNVGLETGQVVKNINFGNYESDTESCHVGWDIDIFNTDPNTVEVGMNINNQSGVDANYALNVISSPSMIVHGFTATTPFDPGQPLPTPPIFVPSMESVYVAVFMSPFPDILGPNGEYQVIATNLSTGHSFGCSAHLWPNDEIGVRPVENLLVKDLLPGEPQEFLFEVRNLGGERLEAQLRVGSMFTDNGTDLDILRVGQVEPQKVALDRFEAVKVTVPVELLEHIPNGIGDVILFADSDDDGEPNAATSIIVRSAGSDECVRFNDLRHCPLGDSRLSVESDMLHVSETDSSDQDGVYAEVGQVEYVLSTLGDFSLEDASQNLSLIFTAIGTVIANDGSSFDDQQLSIVRLQADRDGRLRISGNMGGIGTEVPRAEIYNDAGELVGRSDFGRLTADMPITFEDWSIDPIWAMDGDAISIIEMPTEIDITIGEDEVVQGSQIHYVGTGLARNVGPVSRLDIGVRGIPAISLKETRAVPFGDIKVIVGNTDGSAQQVAPGDIVDVPVIIQNIPPDVVVGGISADIHYDEQLLKPVECEANPDEAMKIALCHIEAEPGIIRMNMASKEGLTKDTRIASIRFQAIGPTGSSTKLEMVIEDFIDYDGQPLPVTTQGGLVDILALIKGDVNCDDKVSVVDALFVFQHVIGSRLGVDNCPLSSGTMFLPGGDVDDDQDVDAVDGLFILQCDVGLPNVLCEEE